MTPAVVVGRSLGPIRGTDRWRFVVATSQQGIIDRGSIVCTEHPLGTLVSSVVEVDFNTNVTDIQSYLTGLAMRHPTLADSSISKEIKAVAVAVCAPIRLLRASAHSIEGTVSNRVPPGEAVVLAGGDIAADIYGVSPKADVVLGEASGLPGAVGVRFSDFRLHAVIAGVTGSGKTRLAASIASQLAGIQDCSVVVIDVHGEYPAIIRDSSAKVPLRSMRAGVDSGSGLKLSDLSPEQLVSFLTELPAASAALVRDAHSEFLRRWLERDRNWIDQDWAAPNQLKQLVRIVEQMPHHEKSLGAVHRALDRMISKPVFKVGNHELCRLDDGLFTALDTRFVDSTSESVFVAGCLKDIFEARRRQFAEGDACPVRPLFVIIEEAHRFCNDSNPANDVVIEYVREARKYQVSVILVTQRLVDIAGPALANVRSILCMRIGSSADAELLCERFPDFAQVARASYYFDVGRGVYFGPRSMVPLFFQAMDFGRGSIVSHAEVGR